MYFFIDFKRDLGLNWSKQPQKLLSTHNKYFKEITEKCYQEAKTISDEMFPE